MAGEERQTTFTVSFEGRKDALLSFLNALKGDMRSTVRDLQQSADSLTLFRTAQADANKAQAAFEATRKRLEDIRAEIKRVEDSGGTISRGLARGLKEAESAFASHAKAMDRANIALESARNNMNAATVAASKLAAEQKVLAAEWTKQRDAAVAAQQAAAAAVASSVRLAQEVRAIGLAFQANKDALGFKSLRDVQPEIDKVRRAFTQLKDSGQLSFGEVSVAAARMQQKVAELRSEAGGVGEAFVALRGRILGIAAAFAGVAAGAVASARNFRDFAQAMAAVDSIAGANAEQLQKLSDGVRRLARDMGVDAVESAKALYEILSSGIPAANALTVLEQATKAAVAGMTTVDTAARVGVAVLNSYGLEVTELGRVFDVLFRTVDSGVITFPELANNLGDVTATARSAKVNVETLGASFVLLTKAGINAAESATAIRGAILAISAPAPEARERFRELGIELGNFADVIKQIGERNLSLDVIRQIIPDARASKAVQVLAQNFEALGLQITKMNEAAGATEAAYGKLANTPQARLNRFNAAIKDLSISIGEFVTSTTDFVGEITKLVNGFNALDAGTRNTIIQFTAFGVALVGAVATLRTIAPLLNVFVGTLFQSIPALAKFKLGVDAAALSMRGLALATGVFIAYQLGKWADENVPAMQKFFDVLEIAGGNLALQVETLFDGISEGLRGNREGFDAASKRARFFTKVMQTELANVLSGATANITALTKEQARLRDELGKAIGTAQASAQGVGTAVAAIAANVKTLLLGVEQQMQVFEGRLSGVVAKMAEAVTRTQELSTQAQSAVAERLKQQLAELATLSVGEAERLTRATELRRKALDDQLKIIQEFAKKTRAAFEAEAEARIEVAKRSGENLVRVEAEINARRRDLLAQTQAALRAHLAEALAAQKQHQDAVKSLEDQRRALASQLEKDIREIRREGLTDYQLYVEKTKDIDELQSKARQALLKGDLEAAERYAKEAYDLAKQLNTSLEQDGQVIIDRLTGQNKKVGELTESAGILNQVIGKRKDVEREAAEVAKDSAEKVQLELRKVTSEIDKMQMLAAQGIELKAKVDRQELDETLAKLAELQSEENRLIDITAKVRIAEGAIEQINRDLSAGVTVNMQANTEQLTKALDAINKAEPSLQVKTDEAIAAIDGVRAAAKALEEVRIRLQLNDDALKTAKETLKTLDDMDGKTFKTTLEVNVVRTGDQIPQGVGRNEGGPIPRFARGGYVGRARARAPAQAFARGGDVFGPLRSRKVPGVGNEDTHPARLRVGSFVLRKRAAQYYGDRLLDPLHGAQKFAVGGFAQALLGRPDIARLLGGGGRKTVNYNAGQLGRGATGEIVEAAIRVFQPLLDASRTLPRSRTGQNLIDYLSRVLDIITSTYSPQEAASFLEKIASISDNLMASIRTAHQFRVPIVMGAFANPSEETGPSELFKQLMANMRTGGTFKQGTSNPYAGGGHADGPRGTDTIPAWLTPGEHVINADAVRGIKRVWGADFLHRLNRMQIPRGAVQRMTQAPRVPRFATGGEVSPSGAVSSPGRTGGDPIMGNRYELHLHGIDTQNPEEWARRKLFPLLDERERRRK